ncbi:MAG: GHMP kinase, partial [Thermacetogeniaceae bacterium]
MILRGVALMPASCGELVQGTSSGVNFLVSCPVNWYSLVSVRLGRGICDKVSPSSCSKAARAARLLLDRLGYQEFGAEISVSSAIPVGKGMASSTADIAAACYAVAAALGIRLDPRLVAQVALSIEPTDGTFVRGIALFDHVKGRIFEELGSPPPMGILAVDFGGEVDTLEFNGRPDLPELNRRNEPVIARALSLVRLGIAKGDPRLVGEGATISALANQSILPKPRLEELVGLARRIGAYGVNVAH